jgi:hypothetical protein
MPGSGGTVDPQPRDPVFGSRSLKSMGVAAPSEVEICYLLADPNGTRSSTAEAEQLGASNALEVEFQQRRVGLNQGLDRMG